eukprot:gene36006-40721_t
MTSTISHVRAACPHDCPDTCAIIDSGVKIVETAGNSPKEFI